MTDRRRSTIHPLLGAGIAVLFAACGTGGPSAAPSPTATTAPPSAAVTIPPVTIPPATPPPTQASAPEPCATPPDGNCPSPAGPYHASRIGGGITFELVGAPWTNVVYLPVILSFVRGTDWVAFMHAPVNVRKGEAAELTSDPAVAMSLVAKLPGMTVTPAAATTIDGHPALVFDIVNTGTDTVTLWYLADTSGNYALDPDVSVRMHWIDLDGTPFIVALESPNAGFAAYLTASQPVIDSIVFD